MKSLTCYKFIMLKIDYKLKKIKQKFLINNLNKNL